jgi:aryl-phospho-beta-D-glucosidase BglC (GH1 family)
MLVAGVVVVQCACGQAEGAPQPSGQGGYLLPPGYFTTRGSQIVDGNGVPVRIASVGWSGVEEPEHMLVGLDAVNYRKTMRAMQADGFNAIRLPWSDRALRSSPLLGTLDYELNPGLKGLTTIQIMDRVITYAGILGMRVILDHHTDDGGGGQQRNGLWFDKGPGSDGTDGRANRGTVTQAKFEADTLFLAQRYRGNPTIIGFDLDNEPFAVGEAHHASLNWGRGGPTDIWRMYTRVGDALLRVNPNWLIICEGPLTYSNTDNGLAGIGPEGDLSAAGGMKGVLAKPVVLIRSHQVVYSVHEYGPEINDFRANRQASTLIAHMNADWGYLYTKNIAPVWIGEIGSSLRTPQEQAWAQAMVDYLNGKDGAEGGPVFTGRQQPISTSWWVWGYYPGGHPDGTVGKDWITPRPEQQRITNQLLYRPKGEPEKGRSCGAE